MYLIAVSSRNNLMFTLKGPEPGNFKLQFFLDTGYFPIISGVIFPQMQFF